MHLDMRYEVEDVGADDRIAQQAKLDTWRHQFNHTRSHERLERLVPSATFRRSIRGFKYGSGLAAWGLGLSD